MAKVMARARTEVEVPRAASSEEGAAKAVTAKAAPVAARATTSTASAATAASGATSAQCRKMQAARGQEGQRRQIGQLGDQQPQQQQQQQQQQWPSPPQPHPQGRPDRSGTSLASTQQLNSLHLCSIECGEIGSFSNDRIVKIGVDSGAGVTVWPKDLCDDYPLKATPESRAGLEYVPAGKGSRGIVDLGERTYDLTDTSGQNLSMKVHVCDVRKPLLSVAEMNDMGLDVHFYADSQKGAYAVHAAGSASSGPTTCLRSRPPSPRGRGAAGRPGRKTQHGREEAAVGLGDFGTPAGPTRFSVC